MTDAIANMYNSLKNSNTIKETTATVAALVPGAASTFSTFGATTDTASGGGGGVASILGTIIFIVALYFAFKCKTPTGGVDILQVLLACCCSPCYVAYRLAVSPCK